MNLSLKNLHLSYSHKTVLKDLSIDFEGGQVYGILGENGAGKSTMANIICGELQPDSGRIYIDGKEVTLHNPKAAIDKGICYVHQHPMVAESLTILENLKIGLKKRQFQEIDSLVAKWIPGTCKNTLVHNTGADTRFFIALMSALLKNPKILLLDEPTALLNQSQKEILFNNLTKLASEGMNIIIITHNLDEAEKYCTSISCIEDGTIISKEEYYSHIKKYIQKNSADYNISELHDSEKKSLEIEFQNLTVSPKNHKGISNLNFKCISGKITAIRGQTEDGILTLENALCGFDYSSKSGRLRISGNVEKELDLKKGDLSPLKLRKNLGFSVGIIPTDRKYRGANPELTIKDVLCYGETCPPDFCSRLIDKAGINIKETEKTSALSGGMLQRLIITRELESNPDFLILCNPMQGLDPSTCENLKDKIVSAAKNGAAVLILTAGDFDLKYAHYSYLLEKGSFK